MIVKGRWAWTADRKRLVPDTDPEAAFLAYFDGADVADNEALRVGLLKAQRPAKAVRKPADKMMSAPQDK